jgi:polyhydroxyalkanoate synthesis regulator phasin
MKWTVLAALAFLFASLVAVALVPVGDAPEVEMEGDVGEHDENAHTDYQDDLEEIHDAYEAGEITEEEARERYQELRDEWEPEDEREHDEWEDDDWEHEAWILQEWDHVIVINIVNSEIHIGDWEEDDWEEEDEEEWFEVEEALFHILEAVAEDGIPLEDAMHRIFGLMVEHLGWNERELPREDLHHIVEAVAAGDMPVEEAVELIFMMTEGYHEHHEEAEEVGLEAILERIHAAVAAGDMTEEEARELIALLLGDERPHEHHGEREGRKVEREGVWYVFKDGEWHPVKGKDGCEGKKVEKDGVWYICKDGKWYPVDEKDEGEKLPDGEK